MAFFSNVGNESSSSSGHSSASDSDSEEKRFYQKINNSQRQRSSSTSASSSDSEQVSPRPAAEKPVAKKHDASPSSKKSDASDSVRNQGTLSEPNLKVPSTSKRQLSSSKSASSSDSEPEQMSSRKAAEKAAVTLSPNKKTETDASDSSAVRNQGTPSEPNLKAPSTSKLKKVVAGKRAKVDDTAEEQQPEAENEPSNATKKKQQRQKQESAAAVEDPKASNTVEAPGSSTPMLNGKSEDRLDYETFRKETRDMLAEFNRDVKNKMDNFNGEMMALLNSHWCSTNGTRGAGVGRRRHSLVAWLRSQEPNLEDIYSLWERPAVDEARLQVMEGKWREVQLLELEANSQRLALLQEQCIEAQKATRGNAIS